MSADPTISATMSTAIANAAAIVGGGIPRRGAVNASTDQVLNLACAVAALDTAAAAAADLLAAIDQMELQGRPGLCRANLTDLLVQLGYVTLSTEADDGQGQN